MYPVVNPYMHTAHTCVHVKYICMHAHTNIDMDTHIYETKGYSVYCSKFHPDEIHKYRLTYCLPLHLFIKILLLVLIELFNKLGLFKLLWDLIPSLEALIE